MDVLSDVLQRVHLSGAVFFNARLHGPWSVASPGPVRLGRLMGLGTSCPALFHLVGEGRCWITLEGGAPIRVEAGTILVLPRADPHRIGSAPNLPATPFEQLVGGLPPGRIPSFQAGPPASDDGVRLVCGYLKCAGDLDPLIGSLPPLLLAQPGQGRYAAVETGCAVWDHQARPEEDDGWLARTFRHTVEEAEAQRPGNVVMLPRLTELLLVELLRYYLRVLPAREGWLAAARDPQVGRALRLLHQRPAHHWTVAELAHEAGVSRSALAGRFRRMVGRAPMQYLAAWRMELAKELLREPALSVAQVAARVGFDSSVAFHRAFKRHTGQPPAAWRSARES